jgi:hypothetical protein
VNTLLLATLLAMEPAPLDGGVAQDDGPALDAGVEAAVARDDASPSADAPVWLRGRILAKGSQGPVSLATVVAKTSAGAEARAEADDDGKFEVRVACGERVLSVRAPGYEPLSIVTDACAKGPPLQLRLVPRPGLPVYETLITAERDQPSVDLRGAELTSTPGSLGDPLRTIESLPGVAVVAWPAPIYAIRGSNPGNTGYFLDQLEVPLLFHLALGPSVIHPFFFDSLSFFPGGYPVQLGRYVGGAVATETRAPPGDRVHASADLRLYDAGGLISLPLPDGNGGVAAAFRYSYTGTLLSLLRNDVKLAYWDYQLRADRKVGSWKLTLLTFGSSDDLNYRVDNQTFSNEYRLQFHRISLRARHGLRDGQLSLQLAVGYDYSLAPIVQDTYAISASAEGIYPRIAYERSTEHWLLLAGADGELQAFWPKTNVEEVGESDLARDRLAALLGIYASATYRLDDRLAVTPGLRWDGYLISGSGRQHLDPRISARLNLDKKTWLTGSAGRFSQAPSLGVQLPAAQNFGLSLYGLQSSWQASVGFGRKALPGVEVELTGYLHLYSLTDLRDPALAKPDPLASDFLIRREARSYGLEVMIRRPASERLYGWIAYTLSQSQRAMGGGVIGPSDWDQRHILNAVAGYRIAAYTLGLRAHYNSGRPVLINGAVTGAQAETFVRLPAFYQLDLRAERRFLFDAFTLAAYVEVVNTTLTREVYQLSRDQDGELREQSLRVFLPSLGLRGQM